MLSAKELYILNLEALDHIGMRVGQVSNWDDVSQPSKDYFGYLVRVINLHYTGSLSGNGITLHASDTSTLEGFLVALTAMPKEQRQKVYEFLYDMEHRIYAR